MIVGVMTWELHLAACHSLKDKRSVLKSLKDRLHHKFNVSAAETDHHDTCSGRQRSQYREVWDRVHRLLPIGAGATIV